MRKQVTCLLLVHVQHMHGTCMLERTSAAQPLMLSRNDEISCAVWCSKVEELLAILMSCCSAHAHVMAP